MQHSSRRAPCPICQRDSDDKCRWSETRIFCYNGDSFSPPQYLKLGDKIKVHGIEWKLFSFSAGFSGNSYAFGLNHEKQYRFLSRDDKRAFRVKCVQTVRLFIKKKKAVDSLFSVLTETKDLERLTTEEFYSNKNATEKAIYCVSQFFDFTAVNKTYISIASEELRVIKSQLNALKELRKDIDFFECAHLGTRPAHEWAIRLPRKRQEGASAPDDATMDAELPRQRL
jgi:hypothetical protein